MIIEPPSISHATTGLQLDATDAERLESTMADSIDSAVPRAMLLGFYFVRHIGVPELGLRRHRHALWMIKHFPANALCGTTFVSYFEENNALYDEMSDQWIAIIAQHPRDPDVLGNAALFYQFYEVERAKELLAVACSCGVGAGRWKGVLDRLSRPVPFSDGQQKWKRRGSVLFDVT